ncbi:hypothetical protein [Methylomonas rhizoryzae]|uniref:hypothetical protein n=1 Tax=Methylomonas rhizoryzae TaxID=2608981 RepID=UPI001231B27C|nr:hypothetical protein [Methylomonas rhizoryzae]
MQIIKHIVFFVFLCSGNLVHAGVWTPVATHGDLLNGVMPFVEADSTDFQLFDTPNFSFSLPASTFIHADSAANPDSFISRPALTELAFTDFAMAKHGILFRGAQTGVEPLIAHFSIPVFSDNSASKSALLVNNPIGNISNKALPQLAWMMCGAMMCFLFLERPKKTDTLAA